MQATLKDHFSSRTDPPIFTSIPPVLLDQSNGTSWGFSALKSASHFLLQSTGFVFQIQVQKPMLAAATDQMPDYTYGRE